MVNILGCGAAYPENKISNDLLVELGAAPSADWILSHTGIENRSSILPLDYIRDNGNVRPADSLEVASETPTDLGVKAATQAIERAGIKVEDIGLILGSSTTPVETSPNEAQRVGKGMGLKIPAFDVSSSSGDFALHLDVLNSWKEAMVPDYVLCVSCNTPTRKVNYKEGAERIYLGDAASAVVVSAKHSGKLSVSAVNFKTSPKASELIVFDLYKHAKLNPELLKSWMEPQLAESLKLALETGKVNSASYNMVASGMGLAHIRELCEAKEIAPERLWSNLSNHGYSLGSSEVASLSEHWDSISAGEEIVVTIAGAGTNSGYVILKG